MKFFVYHGYVTPDNCDASEGWGPYVLDVFTTAAQVEKCRAAHEESCRGGAQRPVFRVFQGEELVMQAEATVTQWKLRTK